MITLALVSALIVALLSGALILFESKAMWGMNSPNARAWNATLNCSATYGFSIIPIIILIIGVAFICLCKFGSAGFG